MATTAARAAAAGLHRAARPAASARRPAELGGGLPSWRRRRAGRPCGDSGRRAAEGAVPSRVSPQRWLRAAGTRGTYKPAEALGAQPPLTAQQQRRRQQRRRQQRRRQQRRRQQRQHQQRRQRRQPPQRTTWDPQWAPPGLRTSGAGAAIAQQRRPWLGGLG
ncbi:hypothetical protein MNEG_15820, partial [Monoraphidium neglectum]